MRGNVGVDRGHSTAAGVTGRRIPRLYAGTAYAHQQKGVSLIRRGQPVLQQVGVGAFAAPRKASQPDD